MSDDKLVTKEHCDRVHSDDVKRWEQVFNALSELNNRLYKDNGHISIQTRLDRGDRILGILCWAMTVAGGAVIVAILAFVYKTMTHVGI